MLHCFDCTQTHIIVAYLIKQGAPVIKWTTLSEKKTGSGPKNVIEMVFLGFSHITARKRFAILLCRSDDAQTYRIIARFNLEGGKTKIRPQNISQLLFTTSEISRVSRS